MDASLERAQGFDKLQGLICQDPEYTGLKLANGNGIQFVSDVVSHALSHQDRYGEALAEAIASQYQIGWRGERFIPHPDAKGLLYLDREGHLVSVEGASILPTGRDGCREIVYCHRVRFLTGPNAGRVFQDDEARDAIQIREADPTYRPGVITEWVRASPSSITASQDSWCSNVVRPRAVSGPGGRDRSGVHFEVEAIEKGIVHDIIQNGEFSGGIVRTDGVSFKTSPNGSEQVCEDMHQDTRRKRAVGTYDSNNGLVAFVDEHGDCYVVRLTEKNIDVLKRAGYQQGNIYVPFSNGEVPTDPSVAQTLKEIRAQRYED